MSAKRTYWLKKARVCMVGGIGAFLITSAFLSGNQGLAFAVILVTIVACALTYLFVDRKNVRELEG